MGEDSWSSGRRHGNGIGACRRIRPRSCSARVSGSDLPPKIRKEPGAGSPTARFRPRMPLPDDNSVAPRCRRCPLVGLRDYRRPDTSRPAEDRCQLSEYDDYSVLLLSAQVIAIASGLTRRRRHPALRALRACPGPWRRAGRRSDDARAGESSDPGTARTEWANSARIHFPSPPPTPSAVDASRHPRSCDIGRLVLG